MVSDKKRKPWKPKEETLKEGGDVDSVEIC